MKKLLLVLSLFLSLASVGSAAAAENTDFKYNQLAAAHFATGRMIEVDEFMNSNKTSFIKEYDYLSPRYHSFISEAGQKYIVLSFSNKADKKLGAMVMMRVGKEGFLSIVKGGYFAGNLDRQLETAKRSLEDL